VNQVPDTFHVSSYPREGHAVVDVQGDIDLQSAPLLRQALLDCAEQGDQRVILNLAEVAFLDSTGLSAIIAGLRAMESRQGSLMLAGIAPQVQRLLDLTHLSEEFQVFTSVQEAIASGNGPEPAPHA
jgi:anti-sigma B factor antagonist